MSTGRVIGIIAIVVFVVIVFIGIIAAIAIPSLLNARRNSNQSAAVATCRNFGSAAVDFAMSQSDGKTYWENDTTDFGSYFSHVASKGGYMFAYFSDDNDHDGVHEATKFCYVAWPSSLSSGRKAFLGTESVIIFSAELTSEEEISMFEALDHSSIIWEGDAAKDPTLRLQGIGLAWGEAGWR
jgi:type II secretory pathway pseudopilin PulG